MAAWKRQRQDACTPVVPAPIEWTLPAELLLEIIARSDVHAFISGAATCKLLRRDILSPPFIRRVTQQGGIVPPCMLAYLMDTHDNKAAPSSRLSPIHPAPPSTMSFIDGHLIPYMSCSADDLLIEHYPVVSRGGLILLRRRHHSNSHPNLCVYDPITGHRTSLSYPPGTDPRNPRCMDSCILLTAADGIDSSFLLFSPRLHTGCRISGTSAIKVHIATSTCRIWTPADDWRDNISHLLVQMWFKIHNDTVVLHGGVIHWLVQRRNVIVTYNVRTMRYGKIPLSGPVTNFKGGLHLASHDGQKLLYILGVKGFNISVWHQLSSGDWTSEAMTINTEEKLRSVHPDISLGGPLATILQSAGMGSSVVLRLIYRCDMGSGCRALLLILDLETMEMRVHHDSNPFSILLEVDLPSRLRAMKIFS